jgi:hypothetical protein
MKQLELGPRGVQAGVVKTYEACGCVVERTAQSYRRGGRRNPGTPGLPDLYVWPPLGRGYDHGGPPWWHESKTEEGKLSAAQKKFQERCAARGVVYVPGGVPEAIAQLQKVGLFV